MKPIPVIAAALALLVGGFFLLNSYIYNEKQADAPAEGQSAGAANHKDAEYIIEGQRVKLAAGIAETEVAPGSAVKMITRYFGNELKTDLNNDGREDIVFLLTQEQGGSGTFFYAVAALNTENGYVGSDGYLLGDRIAPQTTNVSPNPRHKNVVVVNYADRAPGEPMTARPSVGKSAYLKLNAETMQWGVVEPDFEGESNITLTEAEARVIAERTCIKGGEALGPGTYNANSGTWWFDANLNATKPGCSPACVVWNDRQIAEINWRCTGAIPPGNP